MMDMTKDDNPLYGDEGIEDFDASYCEPSESPEPLPLDPIPPDARRTCYYYIRNSKNHPIITVCLIRIGAETARGIAICAPKPTLDRTRGRWVHDTPSKARGRDLAAKRARKAIVKRTNDKPVNKPAIKALVWQLSSRTECCIPDWKSEYMPSLTHFEHDLLYGVKGGSNGPQ